MGFTDLLDMGITDLLDMGITDMGITVNIGIFASMNFHGFIKMDNFMYTEMCVLSIIGSLSYYKSNFRGLHIFAHI